MVVLLSRPASVMAKDRSVFFLKSKYGTGKVLANFSPGVGAHPGCVNILRPVIAVSRRPYHQGRCDSLQKLFHDQVFSFLRIRIWRSCLPDKVSVHFALPPDKFLLLRGEP
jgi:hypothetical protein